MCLHQEGAKRWEDALLGLGGGTVIAIACSSAVPVAGCVPPTVTAGPDLRRGGVGAVTLPAAAAARATPAPRTRAELARPVIELRQDGRRSRHPRRRLQHGVHACRRQTEEPTQARAATSSCLLRIDGGSQRPEDENGVPRITSRPTKSFGVPAGVVLQVRGAGPSRGSSTAAARRPGTIAFPVGARDGPRRRPRRRAERT